MTDAISNSRTHSHKRHARAGLSFPALVTAAVAFTTGVSAAADVERECRGVAAGVVASMRANGELTGDEAVRAAVTAARRACAAALEGLGSGVAAKADSGPDAESGGEEDQQSVWEFLSQEQDSKPGNERLRRLRN